MLLDAGFVRGMRAVGGSLRELRLSFCHRLTPSGLVGLQHCRSLIHVDLSHLSWLSDTALATVVGVCPQIVSLRLAWCDKITVEALPFVAKLTSLRLLDLAMCGLTTRVAGSVIGASQALPALRPVCF